MRNFLAVLFSGALCVLLVSSCDSLIDAEPQGQLNEQTFYNTQEDFRGALFGTYSTLLNLYYNQNGYPWLQGNMYPSDDVRPPGTGNSLERFDWNPTNNGKLEGLWNEMYKGILRANTIIEQLPESDIEDESVRASLEGEARFLRGYFHFVLAQFYGNAPVVNRRVTQIDSANIGNSEPGEIWAFIERDLQFASDNLPPMRDDDDKGRATRFTALALLGKTLLFDAQWNGDEAKYQQAAAAFNQIVESGNYRLMDRFRDNFGVGTENNAESLFEVQMTRGDANPWLPVDHPAGVGAAGTGRIIFSGAACYEGNCAPGATVYGYGRAHATQPLQEAFEEGDPRAYFTYYLPDVTYPADGVDGSEPWSVSWSITGATPAKYVRSELFFDRFPANISTDNERVIRYADVLLMLAEAELLGNGNAARAAELVNQVRERARNNYDEAYGEPAPEGVLPPVSAGALTHETIRHERRVELAMELKRYNDLVRWHRAGLIDIATDIDFGTEAANDGWTEKNLLHPIPQGEIDNNENLTQNPGY